jgi:transposase
MRSNFFGLSDEQWARIKPHLPTDVRGKERVDDRRIISGIVHMLKSGCRWKDCPAEYGPHTTVYNRFTRWAERGVWEGLFRAFAQRSRSTATQMIDSTALSLARFLIDLATMFIVSVAIVVLAFLMVGHQL